MALSKDPFAPDGRQADTSAVHRDAKQFALAFVRDARALHCHNHDHNCSFTCVKYVAQAVKKLAGEALNTGTNIVCRFFFYVLLIFKVIEAGTERVRRVRRRGKQLVPEPFIATTNEHNELGRVQVVRRTPFRAPTSDVGQTAARCNLDFQFMPRGPVLSAEQDVLERQVSAAKPATDAKISPSTDPKASLVQNMPAHCKNALAYEKAESFYGIRFKTPGTKAIGEVMRSMLAMWQAAHNTDFYITKYGTKALEQVQNLIGQFALGLRRLELQEEQEREAARVATPTLAGSPHPLGEISYKQRARRVTLRMAMAANRSTWVSCCEMALFIRTGAHARKTYFPRNIYLSRLAYLCHACERLLRHPDVWLLEASEQIRFGATDMSVIALEKEASPTTPARSSDELPKSGAKNDNHDPRDDSGDDSEDPKSKANADLVQMKTLRETTSTHDDWLHRGPYLHDLPFHTYTEYVDRVRMPRQCPSDTQLFQFEPHYALSGSYCQVIRTPARIPVLEALRFMPPGEGTAEDNALYKHIVGSLTRCTCTGTCSDPLLFKPFLCYTPTATKSEQWRFRPAWKARRAELEVLARRGERKTERARRVPCIHDTTLVRGRLAAPAHLDAPDPAHRAAPTAPVLLRATLAQLSIHRFNVMWSDAFSDILLFLDASNTHPDQLTLAEFAAIRTRRLVQHLDMMAVARTVRLTQDDTTHSKDTHEEHTFNADPKANICQSEFMGGEHDMEEQEATVAEEDLVQCTPSLHARVTLHVARDILRRDEEITAAKKPGRHKDSDQQMKAFADRFGDRLSAPLPALLTEQHFQRPQLLGASTTTALAHQQAVRSAMRKEQQDLQTNGQIAGDEKSLQAMLAALENLRQQDAEATCSIQELPDLMRGPKHVAERIMKEQACQDPPHVLNDEQITLYALWVDAMQQAFMRRSNPDEPFLPLDYRLFRHCHRWWRWLWQDNAHQPFIRAPVPRLLSSCWRRPRRSYEQGRTRHSRQDSPLRPGLHAGELPAHIGPGADHAETCQA